MSSIGLELYPIATSTVNKQKIEVQVVALSDTVLYMIRVAEQERPGAELLLGLLFSRTETLLF